MENQKTACITGITGYIGSNLAKRLIKEQWNVHGIIRATSQTEKLQKELGEQLTLHIHNEKTNSLKQIIKQSKPDLVIHLASKIVGEHTYEDINDLIDSNIKFGTQLIEAMVENKTYKLINTGTYWQHYNNEEYNPVNLYAASKQALQSIMRYYQETTPLQTITLELFDTYGPNDPRPKIMSLLSRTVQTGEELAMTKGEQLIDLVYIDDIIKAYIKTAEEILEQQEKIEKTYVVTSGQRISLYELTKTYEQQIGKKLKIKWGAKQYRKREIMTPWTKGTPVTNWKAEIELQEGIKSLIKCNKIPTGGGGGHKNLKKVTCAFFLNPNKTQSVTIFARER